VAALRNIDTVKVPEDVSARMQPFLKWGTAAEPGLGLEPATMLRAYQDSLFDTAYASLEGNHVVRAIRKLLGESSGKWEGTPTALVTELTKSCGLTLQGEQRERSVLRSLRDAKAFLETTGVGFSVEMRGRDRDKHRWVTLWTDGAAGSAGNAPSATSVPSALEDVAA
jgi:hypothetical protein